jgi:hypothetical protein
MQTTLYLNKSVLLYMMTMGGYGPWLWLLPDPTGLTLFAALVLDIFLALFS